MDWLPVVTAVVGAAVGSLGQILAARLSKSKHERDAGLAKEYLSLANITADELEKRINLIVKLDDDIRKLNGENFLLSKELADMKEKRAERDEQMESLDARTSALQAQIDKDANERADLRSKLSELDARYRVLWRYLIALLEQLKRHDITPVEPPDALKSDPEIARLLSKE